MSEGNENEPIVGGMHICRPRPLAPIGDSKTCGLRLMSDLHIGAADAASYEDVRELLKLYPNHVVEFSCCDRSVGSVPGRNTVIWEVRLY